MDVFLTVIAPILIATIVGFVLGYRRIMLPTPMAFGCVVSKVCVVSADEIVEYCQNNGPENVVLAHLRRETAWKQLKVIRRYVGQMTWNTKLFQQVARFEELKIDPAKSSIDYEHRETLVLELAEEAAKLRWLLVKGQMRLLTRAMSEAEMRVHAIGTLQHFMHDYKQLELNAVALARTATDECYYKMLVERLGLSGWRLFEGGSAS